MSADRKQGQVRFRWPPHGSRLENHPADRSRVCFSLTCFDEITLQSDQRRAQEEAGWSCPTQTPPGPSPLRRSLQAWGETQARNNSAASAAAIIASWTSADHKGWPHFTPRHQTNEPITGNQEPIQPAGHTARHTQWAEALFVPPKE